MRKTVRVPQGHSWLQLGHATKARALVLIAAVLFSTGGVAIKVGAFTGLQVSAARSAVAAVVLWVLVGPIRPTRAVIGVAAAYAATVTLFVSATKLTTSAQAIFLQSSAPLYLLAMGPLLLRERLRRVDVLCAGAVLVGLVACFVGQPPPGLTAPSPRTGNLLGVLSGVSWAATLVGLRHVGRTHRTAAIECVIVGNVLASVAVLPWAWPYPAAPVSAWLVLVYLGVVQIGLAYLCLTRAVAHLPALDVSMLLLVEPVLNPVWTWMVRAESPGLWAIVGGGLILAASACKGWVDAQRPAASAAP